MRKLQTRLLREYRRIAKEFGVTPEVVQEIEAFQWKFVRDNIGKGRDNYDTFENVYLRYLGTFHASREMLDYINKAKKKQNDRRINERPVKGESDLSRDDSGNSHSGA